MRKSAVNSLLVVALVAPVALFLLLMSNFQLVLPISAVIAVVTGWALNVAWAYAAQGAGGGDQPEPNANFPSIAARFGWACPLVLVLLTWLVWRFALGHVGPN